MKSVSQLLTLWVIGMGLTLFLACSQKEHRIAGDAVDTENFVGQVSLRDSSPVAGAVVSLRSVSVTLAGDSVTEINSTLSDSSGHFQFKDLPYGRYAVVAVEKQGLRTAFGRLDLTEGIALAPNPRLVLREPVQLKGIVQTKVGDSVPFPLKVFIPGLGISARVDERGEFVLPRAPQGRFDLVLSNGQSLNYLGLRIESSAPQLELKPLSFASDSNSGAPVQGFFQTESTPTFALQVLADSSGNLQDTVQIHYIDPARESSAGGDFGDLSKTLLEEGGAYIDWPTRFTNWEDPQGLIANGLCESAPGVLTLLATRPSNSAGVALQGVSYPLHALESYSLNDLHSGIDVVADTVVDPGAIWVIGQHISNPSLFNQVGVYRLDAKGQVQAKGEKSAPYIELAYQGVSDGQGGLWVCGYDESRQINNKQGFLLHFDRGAHRIDSTHIELGDNYSVLTGIIRRGDTIAVTGFTASLAHRNAHQALFARYVGGKWLSIKTYPELGVVRPGSLAINAQGGYALVGLRQDTDSASSVHSAFTIRLNSKGDVVTTRSFASGGGFTGASTSLDGRGFVFMGTSQQAGSGSDIYVVGVDNNLTPVWQRRFGGRGDDAASRLLVLPSLKGYAIACTLRAQLNGVPSVRLVLLGQEGQDVVGPP